MVNEEMICVMGSELKNIQMKIISEANLKMVFLMELAFFLGVQMKHTLVSDLKEKGC